MLDLDSIEFPDHDQIQGSKKEENEEQSSTSAVKKILFLKFKSSGIVLHTDYIPYYI
jgi:hypothetical protein